MGSDDAPRDYVEQQLRAIVGFEIAVDTLEGKFKASQNRSQLDRQGVAQALRAAALTESDYEELVKAPGG